MRLQIELSCMTRAGDFCRALDISRSTLADWRKRGMVVFEKRGFRSFRYESPESYRSRVNHRQLGIGYSIKRTNHV